MKIEQSVWNSGSVIRQILDCDVTYGIPKEHDVRIQKLDIVLQPSTHIVDHP
jgi:hypothetical protein